MADDCLNRPCAFPTLPDAAALAWILSEALAHCNQARGSVAMFARTWGWTEDNVRQRLEAWRQAGWLRSVERRSGNRQVTPVAGDSGGADGRANGALARVEPHSVEPVTSAMTSSEPAG